MQITFDPAKRQRARNERGLDFADAPEAFAATVEWIDERGDDGGTRIITIGHLRGRMGLWRGRGAATRGI